MESETPMKSEPEHSNENGIDRRRDQASQTNDEEYMMLFEARKKEAELERKHKAKEARKAEIMDRLKNGPKPKGPNLGPEAKVEDELDASMLYERHDRRVVRLGQTTVKKIGGRLRNHEVDNMRYVAENTTIPLPKVLDAKYEDGKLTAIIMEYIPGFTLEEIWPDLTDADKETTARELHGYMEQLRNLKGTYVGAVNRGPAIIGNLEDLLCGPFDSVKDFHEFILATMYDGFPEYLKDDFRAVMGHDHEMVFTHADFYPKNILVDQDGHVKAILDWEHAGWYPEYYEMFVCQTWSSKWPEWRALARNIVPCQYAKEYFAMSWITPKLRA